MGLRPVQSEGAELDLGLRMARALRHRGPDRIQAVELPGRAGVFAHSRLRVLDTTEAADQPWVSTCGRRTLVYNGEVYNFRELREDLAKRGRSFRTRSDSEVVLALYEVGGRSALVDLDGMFAFALHDADTQELVLMRDRAGKKPLAYAEVDGGLAFASEIKALAEIEGIADQPDWSALPELLTFGYVGTPRSFFKGIRRLEPAHTLVWTAQGGVTRRRYWSLPEPGRPLTDEVGEAAELLRGAVGRAVRRRLVADVPMGAFLSGGLDSSVIVAEMARACSGPVKSFVAGFPEEPTFDERPAADTVARLFGLEHRQLEVRVTPIELLDKLLWHHDEPYGDSSAVALYGISEMTRQHVTVVQTGDGGDEVLAGYTRFLGGLVADRIPPLARRGAAHWLKRTSDFRGYKNPLSLARRFTEHASRPANEQLLAWNAYFTGPLLRELLRFDVFGADFDPWSAMREQTALLEEAGRSGADRLDQILRHNFATYLLDDLLVKTDRMTMAFGLEARSPFLDTEVIELCFRLPSSMKIRGRSLKWLLKQAYADVLPDDIVHRRKHGFGVPVAQWWLAGSGRRLVEELLLAPGARCHEVLNASCIHRLVGEHVAKERDHGQRIFLLLQLEMWLRGSRRARP